MEPPPTTRTSFFWKVAILVSVFCHWWQLVQPGDVVSAAWVGNVPIARRNVRRNQMYQDVRLRQGKQPCVVSAFSYQTTELGVSLSERDCSKEPKIYLESILTDHGYGPRILKVSSEQLPVVAEIYDRGEWKLCLVTGFHHSDQNEWTAPRLEVQLASNDDDKRVIDFGQLTTIWDTTSCAHDSLLDSWQRLVDQEMDKFPVQHRDSAMDRLYQSRARPLGKLPLANLTKKKIPQLVDGSPCSEIQPLTESVLRKVIKAGAGMSRLADSSLAMDYLYNDYPKKGKDMLLRQMVGASVLSRDAELGGRFKRMPCNFVSAQHGDDTATVESVTLVNGGWVAVDQSVRAGTEARKFAERAEASQNPDAVDADKMQLLTAADERIAQRLECLAMGELFSWNRDGNEESLKDEHALEMDVREALKAMGLPTTPEGAQQALLRIGRWSETPDAVQLEPWSQSALEAARWFVRMDQQKRQNLFANSKKARGAPAEASHLENRQDLTSLPCICVDARRATFLDDAIGVRPRKITGRKVIPDASKYEILIHIADVSDIYVPQTLPNDHSKHLGLLREAAESRGMSRYDLPLGPLHLMPPQALKALSLNTVKIDMTGGEFHDGDEVGGSNRCVTLWAYIDERTGRVIDSGLERTLVSTPMALSFGDASALLEGKVADPRMWEDRNHTLRKARAVLLVVERNLRLWSAQNRQRNQAARKRETRLAVKELVAREMKAERNARDDGHEGFQRSRGHKLVDAALELYGYGVSSLLRRAKSPIPRASGSGASRGARVATAPLRRYIDGIAQRQALAALCGYGGPPLTREECIKANKIADRANNANTNVRAAKQGSVNLKSNQGRQQQALRLLEADLAGKNRSVPAISTGRENEVTIMGVGAIAKCKGVKGSLRPGERVMVKVRKLDAQKGTISVSLVQE